MIPRNKSSSSISGFAGRRNVSSSSLSGKKHIQFVKKRGGKPGRAVKSKFDLGMTALDDPSKEDGGASEEDPNEADTTEPVECAQVDDPEHVPMNASGLSEVKKTDWTSTPAPIANGKAETVEPAPHPAAESVHLIADQPAAPEIDPSRVSVLSKPDGQEADRNERTISPSAQKHPQSPPVKENGAQKSSAQANTVGPSPPEHAQEHAPGTDPQPHPEAHAQLQTKSQPGVLPHIAAPPTPSPEPQSGVAHSPALPSPRSDASRVRVSPSASPEKDPSRLTRVHSTASLKSTATASSFQSINLMGMARRSGVPFRPSQLTRSTSTSSTAFSTAVGVPNVVSPLRPRGDSISSLRSVVQASGGPGTPTAESLLANIAKGSSARHASSSSTLSVHSFLPHSISTSGIYSQLKNSLADHTSPRSAKTRTPRYIVSKFIDDDDALNDEQDLDSDLHESPPWILALATEAQRLERQSLSVLTWRDPLGESLRRIKAFQG